MPETKPETPTEEPTQTLATEGTNAHGIGPDTDGWPNPDYVAPDVDPDDAGPEPTVAEPATLRRLIQSIEQRNNDSHRTALVGELVVAGMVQDGNQLLLGGICAEAISEDMPLLLTNWCQMARQHLREVDHV